jgi:D-3-phosphoglycerate dehydrogenase
VTSTTGTAGTPPARVLAIGDPFMPSSCFAEALASLGGAVAVTELQITRTDAEPPRTDSEHRIREYAGDPADVARAVPGHDIMVVHGAPVTAEVLDRADLRLICCARGGPVNVDVAAATARGIPVANTPGKNAEAVAELTIAFALMLIRGVPRASRHLTDGGRLAVSTYEGKEFIGREAPSLTLGLVGLGHVGREVATRAQALGFRVLAFDPAFGPAPATTGPASQTGPLGVELVTFDDLLASSDLVSLHARATAENRHLFGSKEFARMRPGSAFINTARESLVDESALADALAERQLSGAALDVVEAPPQDTRHPLLDRPDVFVTPHIGGATQETLTRGARLAALAVAATLAGHRPAAVVNPEVFAESGGDHDRQLPASHRRRHRKLPRGALLGQGRAGHRQPAGMGPPRATGRPRRPGLRRGDELAAHLRLHRRRARPGRGRRR